MTAVTLSRLDQHRTLAPSVGLYVSPLQFDSTSDQECRENGPDTIDKDTAFELLDAFYEAGGNFIDTAQDCKNGLSEEWIGEWAEQKCIRDQLVIATKFSANAKSHDRPNTRFTGNNVKSIVLSLEASLKNLRTSYIDIFYIDCWEWSTSVEEVMNVLHNLVVARKIFYLGLSNSPAWICSKANMYARVHGKTPFVIYQGSCVAISHTVFVRDIVPMARVEGMALALRDITLVGGLKNEQDEYYHDSIKTDVYYPGRFSRALEKVAEEVGVEHIPAVAIAYILHKYPHVFPVIGASKVERLLANVKGLEICLSSEQISYIESSLVYVPPAHLLIGNGPAIHSPSNTPRPVPMAVALQSTIPIPLDSKTIAKAWLKEFSEMTASGNADSFATKLFKPDGWFRDVLVFTWNNRTLRGHEKIAGYLEKTLAPAKITNVVLDETPELHPSSFALPFGQGIEFSFRFETPVAFARGLTRLLPTSPTEMKALSVFVMMQDLKGHEESGAETGLYGGHTITWNEVLEERRSKVEHDPQVVIIGGGQSGLHVAARFKQMNISALIIEKNQRIGDNWRRRYPSLTLHTPKCYSTTLYQPYPSNFPLFIPRNKIADWLEYYAKAHDLVVWTNSQVLPRAAYDSKERRWTMQIDRDGTKVTLCPKHVVVATGAHGFPYIPAVPHLETFRGEILHTSQFLGGQKFAGLRVVVIGAGNSSADICQDLSFRGAASVTMVQRSKTCVVSTRETTKAFAQAYPDDRPIEVSDFKRAATPLGMVRVMAQATAEQALAADKEMLEGLKKAGFQHSYGEDGSGPGILYFSRGGGYWLDVGCAELIASGKVSLRQGVQPASFTETGIVFNDGSELPADVVIFATGYTSWKDRMKEIFEPEVVESTKEIWGLDDEDEMCGAYRPTGYPAFWYAAGDFADSRFCSKQLALHIKAEELGLKAVNAHVSACPVSM